MTDDDIKRMHLETTGFDLDASESALIDFARAIEQASRRVALEEAAAFMDKRADELSACGNHTADTMARVYEAEAAAIRKLAKETNNG